MQAVSAAKDISACGTKRAWWLVANWGPWPQHAGYIRGRHGTQVPRASVLLGKRLTGSNMYGLWSARLAFTGVLSGMVGQRESGRAAVRAEVYKRGVNGWADAHGCTDTMQLKHSGVLCVQLHI